MAQAALVAGDDGLKAGDASPVRIGLLAVHGMGEQAPGRFVECMADDLTAAIKAEHPGATVERRLTNPRPTVGCLVVSGVRGADERPVEIFIHEGYWADLDDNRKLLDHVKFWWWGFSMWWRDGFGARLLPDTKAKMAMEPRLPDSELFWVRLRLFLAANLFCVLGLVLRSVTQALYLIPYVRTAAGALVRGAGPIETVVAYIGDVQLYTDDSPRKRPLEREGLRPRAAIRRRVIREMVEVAAADYDRWYVFAHSLGSIVAFNALMETAVALPNYLDRATCDALRRRGWLKVRAGSQPDEMHPPRPAYVARDEVLDRGALFDRLRGLLTYGSPIDKFTVLWPHIAPVNVADRGVLRPDFEWVNLYERNDPVAGLLDLIDDLSAARRGDGGPPLPRNIGYAKRWFVGVAHTHYFAKAAREHSIARGCVRWLLSGGEGFPGESTAPLRDGDRRQPGMLGFWIQAALAYLGLLILGGVFIVGLGQMGVWDEVASWIGWRAPAWLSEWSAVPWLALCLALACCGVVTAAGVLHRFISRPGRRPSDDQRRAGMAGGLGGGMPAAGRVG